MQKCPNCSAPLKEEIERCTFCGSLTTHGLEAKQARAAQEEHERRSAAQRSVEEAAAARSRAQPEVDQAGKWALLSSIIGTVVCCMVPIGPVMGIVFGLRARKLAQEHGLPNPSAASAGLTVGALGIVLSVVMWVAVAVVAVKENSQREHLKRQLASVTNAELDLKTACALAELELMDAQYEGFTALEAFDCVATADVEQDGETALLRDAHFANGGQKIPVFACLRFHTKWTVQQVRGDDDCSAAPPPPKKKPRTRK